MASNGEPTRDVKNHLLFEVATEVAHRGMASQDLRLATSTDPSAVGGIYSVIKSKAPVTTAEYGDRYTLIGPLNHQSVRISAKQLTSGIDVSRLRSRSKRWSPRHRPSLRRCKA